MQNIGIYELEKIQESESLNSFAKKAIDILLSSINDWPDTVFDLDSFETGVSDFIGGEVTKRKIKSTKVDISKDAWKAESLSQLLELFKLYDESLSLKKIIIKLKKYLSEEDFI